MAAEDCGGAEEDKEDRAPIGGPPSAKIKRSRDRAEDGRSKDGNRQFTQII